MAGIADSMCDQFSEEIKVPGMDKVETSTTTKYEYGSISELIKLKHFTFRRKALVASLLEVWWFRPRKGQKYALAQFKNSQGKPEDIC